MARIRSVKPEFFRHEGLQDLEVQHPDLRPMLVFIGLWGHCDKQGVFPWEPRQLALDILPFVWRERLGVELERCLEVLSDAGFVQRFEADGKAWGYIPGFEEHQKINGKEADSPPRYPTPNPRQAATQETTGKSNGSNREAAGKPQGSSREATGKPPRSDGEATGSPGTRNVELGTSIASISSLRSEIDASAEPSQAMPPAPAASGPPDPPVIELPTNNGHAYPVTESQVAEWSALYPAVDVVQELRKMRGWLLANPTKRKTHRGMPRFVVNWLAREQDRGGPRARASPQGRPNGNGKGLASAVASIGRRITMEESHDPARGPGGRIPDLRPIPRLGGNG